VPNRWQAGCGCDCEGSCATPLEFAAAADFTAGVGGTVTDDGDDIDLDGIVNPNSYQSSDAYQIEFYLASGSVDIDVGAITVSADADAQTLSVGATSVECGQAIGSPGLEVYIRVTPDNIVAWAIGEYDQADVYGIATADRSGTVPTFTATWDSATITGMLIRDASATITGTDESPTVTKQCWTAPVLGCPYYFVKTITNNHEYQSDPSINADVAMPDISLTGDDVYYYDNAALGWVGDEFLGPSVQMTSYDNPTTNYHRRISNSIACNASGAISRWQHTQSGPGPFNEWQTACANVFANPSTTGAYSLLIDWPDPTPSTPYPKPQFIASFSLSLGVNLQCQHTSGPSSGNPAGTAVFTSSGTASLTFDVNDLGSGFTLIVTGSPSIDLSGVTDAETVECPVDYNEFGAAIYGDPEDIDNNPKAGVLSGSWTL
jgi:hypothetical protein